jgi:hypothetical protein
MSKQELDRWGRKLRLYLLMHGGVEWWRLNGSVPCELCPHRDKKKKTCPFFDDDIKHHILMTDPGTLEMFFEPRFRNLNHWCAEWIKYV